jgi:hypothetical protein
MTRQDKFSDTHRTLPRASLPGSHSLPSVYTCSSSIHSPCSLSGNMTNSYILKGVAIPTRTVIVVFPVLSVLHVVFLLYMSGVPFYLHVWRVSGVSGCFFTYMSGVFLECCLLPFLDCVCIVWIFPSWLSIQSTIFFKGASFSNPDQCPVILIVQSPAIFPGTSFKFGFI